MRLVLLLLLSLSSTFAAPPESILFVGNSYTGAIKKAVVKLVASSPHKDAKLEFITPGGRNLQQHLGTPKTLARIAEGGWDIVVLQDQSQTPAVLPKVFLESSEALHAAIKKSGARTAYYETWGRRDGDKRNARFFPDYQSMQKALSASYAKAATRDRAILVPVGTTWQTIRKEHPELGRQLYVRDGSHPSAHGALLAAASFYAVLFEEDPSTIPYDHGLPADEAALLRKTAAQVAGKTP